MPGVTCLLCAVPLVPEAFWGSVMGQAVTVHVPGPAGRAPLLPEPVVVAPEVDWQEEEQSLVRFHCAHLAAQNVLVQHLQNVSLLFNSEEDKLLSVWAACVATEEPHA
jgi:hypothetical protein